MFSVNIEKATINNKNYRKVLFTTKNQQLVLMSLEKGEFIHLEKHPKTTQFFKIESGTGIVKIGKEILNKKKHTQSRIKDGMSIIIPPNTWHFIKNTGSKPLKLYTIYSPPEHSSNQINKRMPQ
jgi:mannose-6-phosphate isomerase-like protein (cupin superfamily)